jgi:hypothetical protein
MAIPYILWPFGKFLGYFGTYIFPVWVRCTKKNLATLAGANQTFVKTRQIFDQ